MSDSRKSGGNFRDRKTENLMEMTARDFNNPWNFFSLMMLPDYQVYEWFRMHGLLPTTIPCNTENCEGTMVLKSSSRNVGGTVFRCLHNRLHTRACRANSFFEKSNLTLQDIILFIKTYLDGSSLSQCARFSGVAYKSTAVNWGSFIRELFKEYFEMTIKQRKLTGTVEIDESLFGRRVKHHRGDPNRGLKIWIFGMVERETNTLIIYPVGDRTEDTLLPIIERHVEPGSTIYSDGWSAYFSLNERGYDHFTVVHKYAFKKTYINTTTHEEVDVHTNRIEGAWKHAKDHFKKMSGTKITQFEGHLAEIMWRSAVKSDLYSSFFELVKSVYPLDKPATYHYKTPLFDTWACLPDSQLSDWDIRPGNTDAESQSDMDSLSEGGTSNECIVISDSDDFDLPRNRTASENTLHIRQQQQASSLDTLDRLLMESDPDKTLTETSQLDIYNHRRGLLQKQGLPVKHVLVFPGRKVVLFISFSGLSGKGDAPSHKKTTDETSSMIPPL